MVYCGKPSKGCFHCRTKRSRCDQRKPSCGQCIRAKRQCYGYRDEQALMFRDESKEVIRKVNLVKNMPSAEAVKANYAMLIPINVSINERATIYFFNKYTLEASAYSQGHFEYLSSIYCGTDADSSLFNAITSVGMAGLSNAGSMSIGKTRLQYNKALRLTNAALQDPVEAIKDETLVSVMLLGLYEIVTCQNPQSMISWTKHMEGALALLRLRGPEQFKENVKVRMFLQLRAQFIISCLQRQVAVPPAVVAWSRLASQYETEDTRPLNELFECCTRLCALRSEIKDHDLEINAEMFAEAISIDADLSNWPSSVPEKYQYMDVIADDSDEHVLAGHYHVYHDSWTAFLWNNYRCTRLLLNEIIVRFSSPLNFFSDQHEACLWDLALEICASIPHCLGKYARPADGNLLLWPLFIVASADKAYPAMAEWATKQLERIGATMGVSQGAALARIWKEKKTSTTWERVRLNKMVDLEDF